MHLAEWVVVDDLVDDYECIFTSVVQLVSDDRFVGWAESWHHDVCGSHPLRVNDCFVGIVHPTHPRHPTRDGPGPDYSGRHHGHSNDCRFSGQRPSDLVVDHAKLADGRDLVGL